MKRYIVYALGALMVLGMIRSCGKPTVQKQTPTNTPVVEVTETILPTEQPTETEVLETPTKQATATYQLIATATKRATSVTILPTATVPTVLNDKPSASADSYPCQDGEIKANINSNKYHVPSGQSYAKTKDNVICYATEQEAQAAGFVRAKR